MECCEQTLSLFPLLRGDVPYVPDTIDLNSDVEAREFWLNCMADGVKKVRLIVFQKKGASEKDVY